MSYTPFQPVVCRNVAQAEVDKIGARVNYYSGREEEGTVTSHGTVLLRRDTSTVVVGPSEFSPTAAAVPRGRHICHWWRLR
jgi:hypothetical protein